LGILGLLVLFATALLFDHVVEAKALTADDCGHNYIFLKDHCVKCSSFIFGCAACERVQGRSFLSYTKQSVIQCKTCDYGMYHLELDDRTAEQ